MLVTRKRQLLLPISKKSPVLVTILPLFYLSETSSQVDRSLRLAIQFQIFEPHVYFPKAFPYKLHLATPVKKF